VSPRHAALKLWADDENPDFRALIATAGHAADALRAGAEAMQASADQLRAAATAGQRRLESRPCPDPELGRRLGGLLERFVFIARSLESTTEEYGDGYIPALAHQLRTLLADFTVFIADLGHAIEGH
jgi:hypothetical protein